MERMALRELLCAPAPEAAAVQQMEQRRVLVREGLAEHPAVGAAVGAEIPEQEVPGE